MTDDAAGPLAGMTLEARAALERRLLARRRSGGPVAAPAPVEGPDLPELLRRLRTFVRGWEGDPVGEAVPVFAHHAAGALPPLFWCFNGGGEPVAMARALGSGQPLFALRSLSLLTEGAAKRQLEDAVAPLYADEIARLRPEGDLLIGGNCQSGRVAEAVARRLTARGRRVALLCTLDHEPAAPYPGPLAMFFSAESPERNPFARRADPEADWRRLHPNAVWVLIPTRHETYFEPPGFDVFMDRLARRLAEARG